MAGPINLKTLTGAEEVHRSMLDRERGHDMIERIWMTGFPLIRPPPNLVRPDIPWLRFEPWREVKDGHIARAGLSLQIRADYESDRLSSIRAKLAHGCSEDKEQENAKYWAIAREPFNPPLGRRVPVIFSCAEDTFGLRKKMTLDFGFVVPGFDPVLDTVQIVEERK